MKRIGKNFWKSREAASVFETDSVEEISVHARLASMVNELNPKSLLDFGCGDGPLLPLLNESIEIGLHDINPISLERAKERCRSIEPPNVHEKVETIPEDHFDVAVLSFVVVCLNSPSELSEVLRVIQRSLSPGGTLFLVDTHPCFRDREFVGHHVGYNPTMPFNYNARFHEFPVSLHGPTRDFEFYDFHWTLSDLINGLIAANFRLQSMMELKDVSFNSRSANTKFPPYILLESKKQKSK